jgi:DNA invertase Pin-like site-specific DNA recombinase
MIYGYARVSTKGQAKDGNSLEAQEADLKGAGATKIYSDAFTGTKTNRPQLDLLLKELKTGDTLMVTKLDRIARSAREGLAFIDGLLEKGIKVHVLNLGLMDDSATGKLIRTIFLGFAEFERDMIMQRTQEGKAIARLQPGYKEGRKDKYRKEQIDHAMQLLDDHSYRQVEAITGISKSTLLRKKKELAV